MGFLEILPVVALIVLIFGLGILLFCAIIAGYFALTDSFRNKHEGFMFVVDAVGLFILFVIVLTTIIYFGQ